MDIWFIIGSISAIIPVILIKEYIIHKNILLIIMSLFCYLILMASYLHIFKVNKVSVSYTIVQIIQILMVVLSGILLFKEKINIKTIFGIFLALAAMYFLNK